MEQKNYIVNPFVDVITMTNDDSQESMKNYQQCTNGLQYAEQNDNIPDICQGIEIPNTMVTNMENIID